MQSIELKFHEALETLKEKASASKYNQVCGEYSKLSTIEAKFNCVEAAIAKVIKESDPMGLTNIDEAKKDPSVAMLFGNAPGVEKPITEAGQRTIAKHNGAAHNFVEGSPFNEGGSSTITETTTRKDIFAGGDAIINESLGLTADQQRALSGKQPTAYDTLTAKQKKDFDFARLIGLNEADSFKVAKL
jgi:hypothetical protein